MRYVYYKENLIKIVRQKLYRIFHQFLKKNREKQTIKQNKTNKHT